MFGHLRDKSLYIITAVKTSGNEARKEDVTDEEQRICDVQPWFGLFKIAEKKELSEDSKLNESITHLIGKTLSEFKTLKNPEVSHMIQVILKLLFFYLIDVKSYKFKKIYKMCRNFVVYMKKKIADEALNV